MDAIGFKFDDEILCCFCVESEINNSEYSELLKLALKGIKVFGIMECTNCGLTFGRPQALEAAARLASKK